MIHRHDFAKVKQAPTLPVRPAHVCGDAPEDYNASDIGRVRIVASSATERRIDRAGRASSFGAAGRGEQTRGWIDRNNVAIDGE
jgi:hypothetical protein